MKAVKHSRLHENYTSCIAQKQRVCKTTVTTNELRDRVKWIAREVRRLRARV